MTFKKNLAAAAVLSVMVLNLVPASAARLTGYPSEQMNDQDKDQGEIRNLTTGKYWLKIDTDFVVPGTENPYQLKLFTTSVRGQVRLRDTIVQERNSEREAEYPTQGLYSVPYTAKEFAPPNGLNLVNLPGSKVNLMTRMPFSFSQGGMLDLSLKLPFQKGLSVSMLLQIEKGLYRTYVIDDEGNHVWFDSMFVEAKTMLGKPNILRGIKSVRFLLKGKTVFEMSDF